MIPHLESQGLVYFKNSLSKCSNYLEYGSGGSTVLASQYNLNSIISVDSDKLWADKVESKINRSKKFISINYCDIGPVRDWGIPTDLSGWKNYWKYTVLPWKVSIDRNIHPDLVLIDGRFRVSSFIYSWLNADEGTIILFDDYTTRPEYHILEKIFSPVATHGIMAEFSVTSKFDHRSAVYYLLEYSHNHG